MHSFFKFLLVFMMIPVCIPLLAQIPTSPSDVDSDSAITFFDRYNPVLGGDSIRTVNGIRLNGQFKDYYENGQLMHSGFYQNGQLIYYKNFFPSGVLERFFSASSSMKHKLKIYFPSGSPRSDIVYYKGKSLIWIDYYPNGNTELYEEFHKSLNYYLHLKFYTENGTPVSSLDIINKRKKHYLSRQYHPNGQISEEGIRFYNKYVGDYQKTGLWRIYDESGKLLNKEEYINGNQIGDSEE